MSAAPRLPRELAAAGLAEAVPVAPRDVGGRLRGSPAWVHVARGLLVFHVPLKPAATLIARLGEMSEAVYFFGQERNRYVLALAEGVVAFVVGRETAEILAKRGGAT